MGCSQVDMQMPEKIKDASNQARAALSGACSDEDSALMLQAAEGDEHALRMIIEKWKNPLANYFYRSTANRHSAEDLCQQTFINLYKARNSYTPKAKFSTYLFFIARRVLINEHRKNLRRPSDATDPAEIDSPVNGRTDLEISELEEIFYKTLESMPENQRTAILLLKQQELSYDEIADIMNAKVVAVKTWLHRARQTLREALELAKS